ncbi:MAG: hypothetical protein JST93_08600 [Acidobacteria bacterium]|nr:hypothetical protein [Acidobacteriota bacterium]
MATTLLADTTYNHWHRLVVENGIDTIYDYCANIPSAGSCQWGGPDAKEFTSYRDSGGVTTSVTTRTDVKNGDPSISAVIAQTSASPFEEYIRVTANYDVRVAIDFHSPLLSQIFPNFNFIQIPVVAILMRDDGLVARGESIHLQKTSHWIYQRSVNIDYTNYFSGTAFVDIAGGGGNAPAGIDIVHREDPVKFALFNPFLFTSTSSPEATLQVHLNTFYSANTSGSSITMNFGNTTAIEGIQMFGPNGEDLTAAFTFSLSDGTPLFTTSDVPEPASIGLVFTGLVLACLKPRSRKAAAS